MMQRLLFLGAYSLALLPQITQGDPIQLIQDAPSFYTPGQPVAFDVRLPAVANLGAYNVDLVLESTAGVAGVDFFFDVAATSPAADDYVFPTAVNYFGAANVDSVMRHRITLSDFNVVGVDVVPGFSDMVARVVFRTTETFSGELSLFVDADGLILDTPHAFPMPIIGFDAIQSGIAAESKITLTSVPEPTAATLILLAMVCECSLRRMNC